MDTAQIRRRFVEHFEAAGHQAVPSASLLVPDPTLLFVNAGMVPFKPYFLGQETPPWPRAVERAEVHPYARTSRTSARPPGTAPSSRCAATSASATTSRKAPSSSRGTWSPSRTTDGGWGLEEARLWPSVLHGDDEALALWMKVTGLPEHRIVKLGPKENYWSMGVPGPGGPCSEILYDRGPAYGPEADWEAMGTAWRPTLEDRYLEIWNLVFMQDELSAVRSKSDFDIVGSLPKRNIDTGMGLERVAFLLQGVENMYEIDVMFPVIAKAEELTGRRYGADHEDDVRFRVVADHVRSSMMLISDGVTAGQRGPRLRAAPAPAPCRALHAPARVRRPGAARAVARSAATRWARPTPTSIATGTGSPRVAFAEEHAFRQTLRTGTTIFDTAAGEVRSGGGTVLSGDKAFALHDTYGFPIDLTLEMAAEKGLERRRGRLPATDGRAARACRAPTPGPRRAQQGAGGAYRDIADSIGHKVDFTGYSDVVSEGAVRGIVSDGTAVESRGLRARRSSWCSTAHRSTPRAAASSPTRASSSCDNGARLEVYDVQSPITGLIVHKARVPRR